MYVFLARTIITFLLVVPTASHALSLQVKINAGNEKLAASIRSDLMLQQAVTEAKVTVARINNLYDLADEQIKETLAAKGYYHSTLEKYLTKIAGTTPESDLWIASFDINPGKPSTIKQISLTIEGPGKDDPRLAKFLATPNLIHGKIITHENYENTKEKLLSDFNAAGYLQAGFTQSTIEIDKSNYSASIKLIINSGIQYVFGKITFIESLYPNSLLVRYLPFHPGEPYDLQKLMMFQNNLEEGDLFSKIRFDPHANFDDPKDNSVPIDVRLTPKPRNRYTGKAGYGTDTGARASASWLHRRVQTPGHKLFSYIGLSKIQQQAKVNYIIPGEQAATDRYVFGGDLQDKHIKDLRSRKGEVFTSKSIKRGNLESLYGINYFTETFQITAKSKKQNKKYLLPNTKWIWIDSNEKDDFDYGTRFDLSARAGLKNVLSDTSVVQLDAGIKQIVPLMNLTRLIVRSSVGSVTSKQFDNLPPSLRFFTGGDETVRGFAYNSIGPREIKGDPNSDNIGGKYLFIASAEVERKIYDQLSGVVFYDAGNASNNFGGPLAMAAGFGVRYHTPIGNFRVDIAKPFNTVINKHWRVHITFGTDF